jgi:predicted kinase
MNLKKTTISLFLELAAKTQSSAVIKEFNTPLNTCIQRDQQRERYVGKIYITKKQEQFTKLKNTEFYTALSKLI